MKRMVWFAALAASTPVQAADRSLPHREWGKEATLEMTIDDAQACVAREMAKTGTVLMLPKEGGIDVDWTIKGFGLAPKGGPYFTFMLRSRGDNTVLTAVYRRPMSLKNLEGTITGLGKRCLKISTIQQVPAPPSPA